MGNYANRAQGSRMNPPNQRAHGPGWTWADSLLGVLFTYLEDESGEPLAYEFTVSWTQVQILLFISDFPVIARPFSFYAGQPDFPKELNPCAPERSLVMEGHHFALYGNALYTTSQSAPVLYKYGTYCTTLTNQVATSGYPMAMYLIDHGLKENEEPMKPQVQLDVAANATVMAGRGGYQDLCQEYFSEIAPIILRESDYTEEIARADNIYQYSAGGYTYKCLICGIFAEQSMGAR